MPWFIWLLIAVLALAGETVSTALVLVYVGVAAAVTAVFAAIGFTFPLQVLVFVPLTVVLLALVRPRTLTLLHGSAPRRQISGHSALVDRAAIVEQDVSDHAGMIRLGSGEFWSARSYPPGAKIGRGCDVRIMYIDGLTAFVSQPTESGTLPDLPPDIDYPPDAKKEGA